MVTLENKRGILKNFSIKKEKKKQTRIKKKTLKQLKDEVEDLTEKLANTQDDYIELLKEKGDSFTSQIKYIDVCEEQKEEIAKCKDNVKESKIELKSYKDKVTEYISSILEIVPIKKCKNKTQVCSYLEVLSISNKLADVDMEDIEFICNKYKITKETIKNYDENLYNSLKVKDWEIDN